MTALHVQGIEKRYGGVHALRGVDFELRRGEVHALLGENGAGKSTLIKIISGLVQPDAGTIAVGDATVTLRSAAAAHALGIQTVHQELELAGPLTVAENIFMGRLPTKGGVILRRALRDLATEALQRIGAAIDPDAIVAELSISDRQVVEIVRALVRDVRILILDEPTAALPPLEVDRLLDTVRRLAEKGVSVIYVSHRLDEVLRIADRATILRDGRRVAQLERSGFDRATLVRNILGRELTEFSTAHVRPEGEADIEIHKLQSGAELKDLTFDVRNGEVLGFFGLLGAGQGAIGDAIFGLRPAAAKSCRIGDATGLPTRPREALRRDMGYVPADRKGAGLALGLSIVENLLLANFGSVTHGGFFDWRRAYAHAEALRESYQIRCHSLDQAVRQLSGGNQQKVSVAKWAARGVRRLFLDEPTRGVDVGAKVEIYRYIRSFAAGGGCCMVASSDPAEIASVADRAIVLKNGVKVAELTGDTLGEAALVAVAL
ncbi:MAG TPA: sugar ABC transporter ATP-binding protein [Roseiarcus sp.]|jgi:ABC-type sugar transport system ATPase subunit